jgi:TRAP-type C4-dicarboxylate transport system substrate-binding protein
MRKLVIFVVALLALSFALVGCSGGSNETGSQGSSESANQGSSESANQGSAESVKWIANSVYPENNHIGQNLINFSTKVKEATDGRVEIDVMAGGALGYKGPELLKVVRDGIVPVSDILLSGVAGDEPLYGISTLPFLYRDLDEAKTLAEVARPYYDKVAEEKWNQKILYISPWPISGFWTKNEVTSLKDMQGLKMRTYDQMGALVLEAVGGTPYPLPFTEVYSSLSTGVIDSVLTSTATAVDGKFWEVLDYYLPVSVMMGSNAVTVNLDEFNKLDQKTQEAIIQAAKEVEADIWNRVAQIDEEMEAIVKKNGITTVTPSEELVSELEQITKEIRQNWLEQAPAEAQEIIDKYYEAIGRK